MMKKKFICLVLVLVCLCMAIMSAYAGTRYTRYGCGHVEVTGSTPDGEPDITITGSRFCSRCQASRESRQRNEHRRSQNSHNKHSRIR